MTGLDSVETPSYNSNNIFMMIGIFAVVAMERTENFYGPAQPRISAAMIVNMEWIENIGTNGLSLSLDQSERILLCLQSQVTLYIGCNK